MSQRYTVRPEQIKDWRNEMEHIKSTFSIPVKMDRTGNKGTLEVEFAANSFAPYSNQYYGMTLRYWTSTNEANDGEECIRFNVSKVEIEALVQANKVKV